MTELALLLGAVILLLVAYLLARQSRRNQAETGLPGADISVVYSDSGAWEKVAEPLFSKRYSLVGKPDYIVRNRDGLIPIELKPLRMAAQPYESDIMQLAAYCLLLEEVWEASPPYGLLRYKEKTFRIEWNEELRENLLDTIEEMRELENFEAYRDGPLPEPQHDMTVRCRNCGFHYLCWPG
ncbi:MAG TPA: CRISPR-associated protein Cas4 [Chloroflexia bacterium]|nr:CRISPR-associated protein Cas4 [Chloroflexia bacterium]